MRSLLVGIFVVLAVHSVLTEDNMSYEDIKKACDKELGYKGDVEKLNFKDENIPREAKCALACQLEKQGGFKADGSIDKESQKRETEKTVTVEEAKEIYLKAIDECDTSAKADKCETAYEYTKCFFIKAGLV